jgi:hypothetical protein
MADSDIAITAGSGTKVDTRTVGAGADEHRQVVVIGDQTTATAIAPVDLTLGLSVAPRRDIVAVSTTLANLTLNTTAYAAGDRVGSLSATTGGAAFTWANVALRNGGSGAIVGAVAASQQAMIPLSLYLFTATPTVSAADNSPWVITSFAPSTSIGVVSFGSTRAGAAGGMIASAANGVYLPFVTGGSTQSIFGIVQATGASSAFPLNATDLVITLYVERS